MRIFDAHCDTLSAGRPLRRNSGGFDVERAVRRGGGVQVMAAFGEGQEAQLLRLAREREALAPSLADSGVLALVPALEGADTVRDLDGARRFLALGVRCFGLTWNHDNALGGGCLGGGMGLTDTGRDVIALCESHRVAVDLAHSSETLFWDALECSMRPPVVTHACMAALRPHPRNLSDAQLRALGRRGGVAGVAFHVPFLTGEASCSLERVAEHICHAVNMAGEDAVGIGSDFDGSGALPAGLEETGALPALIERLPLPDRVREKVAYCNFARVLVY
ncbi:MAG: membrane dipeptidase [Oscillospiraceae bacterium]|nr:membrane dipeptidase [Oscillospiraceae bacterium]